MTNVNRLLPNKLLESWTKIFVFYHVYTKEKYLNKISCPLYRIDDI